jgi:hypothetical protein
MPTTKNKNSILNAEPVAIVPSLKDYSKDPYFVKKKERGAAFLKKAGIPEEFKRKAKK